MMTTSARYGITLISLGLLFLAACTAPQTIAPQPTLSPTPSINFTATPQAAPEFAEAAEAWQLLSAYGDQVWPGWGAARIPLLIRDGESDLLAGHPSPPQGFVLLPGVSVADQPIYRYAGHLVPVPAATMWDVNGVGAVAVPTRAEFQ